MKTKVIITIVAVFSTILYVQATSFASTTNEFMKSKQVIIEDIDKINCKLLSNVTTKEKDIKSVTLNPIQKQGISECKFAYNDGFKEAIKFESRRSYPL